MAALDFPASPTNGQIFSGGDRQYIYSTSAAAWRLYEALNMGDPLVYPGKAYFDSTVWTFNNTSTNAWHCRSGGTWEIGDPGGAILRCVGNVEFTLEVTNGLGSLQGILRGTPAGALTWETITYGVEPIARKDVNGDISVRDIIVSRGVKFPATFSGSSDVNTLDDYEEGTWTPTFGAGSGSYTSISGACEYTKIGNRVLWNGEYTITTNGSAAAYTIVYGFPFAFGNSHEGNAREAAALGWMLQVEGNAAGTSVIVLKWDNTYPTDGANGRLIRMNGQYRV